MRAFLLVLTLVLGIFSENAIAAPSAPHINYTISGLDLEINWSEVPGATGYKLYYAPSPYTGPQSIRSIDLGNQTNFEYTLWERAAFFIAAKAYDVQAESGYSNIESFKIISDQSKATYIDSNTGMEFVYVTGGCYQMGDNYNEGLSDELPVHQVCVEDFYMGKYEVTQGQWQAIMGSNPSSFNTCGLNCPVEQVSWDDVQSFITNLNASSNLSFRLPTEAEWEYSARSGGQLQRFSGTNDETNLKDYAWVNQTYDEPIFPVGQKLPNGLGIFDMSGNVWEWVADWYDIYPDESQNNPSGPNTGAERIVRGGAAINPAEALRTACRDPLSSSINAMNVGFRLALPAELTDDGDESAINPGYNKTEPEAPQLSSNLDGTSLYANWGSVPGATGYRLYYTLSAYTGQEAFLPLDVGNQTNFSYQELAEGQTYSIAVVAYNDFGESNLSNVETFTVELAAPNPEWVDDDGDGFTESDGDCNDQDVSINPSAEEICSDGIDQDCSGDDSPCLDNTLSFGGTDLGHMFDPVAGRLLAFDDPRYHYITFSEDGTFTDRRYGHCSSGTWSYQGGNLRLVRTHGCNPYVNYSTESSSTSSIRIHHEGEDSGGAYRYLEMTWDNMPSNHFWRQFLTHSNEH